MTVNDDEFHNSLKNYEMHDKVYIISTRGGRVSFHSQQLRALQLARLLNQKFADTKNDLKVLVIGGGVAGATCFTALNAYGFTHVDGFEAQDQILQTQASSAHRHAHPSYNDWPMILENREFLSTTNLPFMNWFADNTANVTNIMASDPELDKYIENFRTGMVVTNMELVETGILVTSKIVGEDTCNETYNVVICSVGFGTERNLEYSASGSYWWSDHIKHYRSEHQNYIDHTFYVAGTGDGGLIDYVRLGMSVGNVKDENEPNPALHLISDLRDENYRKLDNNWPDKADRMSEYEKKISECFDRSNKPEQTQDEFAVNCRRVIRELRSEPAFDPSAQSAGKFSNVRSMLKSYTHLDRIVLVGENNQAAPYRYNVSPINALLSGLIVEENPKTRYRSGNGKQGLLKLRETISGKAKYASPQAPFIHFARIGSENNTSKLFEECETLKNCYSNWNNNQTANNFIISDYSADFSEDNSSFDVSTKRELAEYFFDRYFLDAEVDLAHSAENDNYSLDIRLPEKLENLGAYAPLGGFDPEIFGLQVNYITEERKVETGPDYVMDAGL